AVFPGIPAQFAYPAALGDLIAAVLALIALAAVVRRSRFARPLVALFNIEGTLDLLLAISLATIYAAAPHMGPAYWIPAFWVPALPGNALRGLRRSRQALERPDVTASSGSFSETLSFRSSPRKRGPSPRPWIPAFAGMNGVCYAVLN